MWKPACYLTGGLFAALASCCVWLAGFSRIEGAGDLEHLKLHGILTGGIAALALVLLGAPRMQGAPRWRYVLLGAGAILIWVAVSGYLIWLAEEQFRIRSSL
jgi:hypothetical protein